MTRTFFYLTALLLCSSTYAFWDFGTTTPDPLREDITPRQSFFRWQKVVRSWHTWGLPGWQINERRRRKRLFIIAGVSIDQTPLSTATILNRRTLLTAANYLDNYLHRQRDLRIWALGRGGDHILPFRYRIWRVVRLFPRSLNPEHCFGSKCEFSPRHDVAILHTMDPIYIYTHIYNRFMYAYKSYLTYSKERLKWWMFFVGSGYEYPLHIKENYKIFFTFAKFEDIIDCSMYLPKWWGKFICIVNTLELTGIQNGGGLFTTSTPWVDVSGKEHENRLVGVGSFQIRYNQDRIYVFTDLRYYSPTLRYFANLSWGEYYEYAYPEFSVYERGIYNIYSGEFGKRFIPYKDVRHSYEETWLGK
ncbi:uncharacterized protein LOC128676376 [Plodia interpunctella]|uniref:uncharacterized protein LOC128676376 n=1 Tax=Plodia interpunctella TaxID=58824 RepID=UPI00236893DB|nr:uncharacterized protein LOC128676376 [Plodia interpunctella]